MIRLLSDTSSDLLQGDRWVIEVQVQDDQGNVASEVPTVTVTSPSGTTSSPGGVLVEYGRYQFPVSVSSAGRYVAVVTATGRGSASAAVWVTALTTAAGMPDLDDVKAYLGDNNPVDDDIQLQDALDTEAAAQRRKCDVGAVYPADLKEALLRRVARNLALRQIPLAVFQGDAETGSLTLPGRDPEVRRLEAPHLKVVLL